MAMIVDAFVKGFVIQLTNFVEGEVSIMLKVKDDLQKLQRRLERIRGFLEHAERKRHEDSNISNWVRDLKDIMYDADDIIDLCIIKGSRLSESHQSISVVCHPFPLFSCLSCMKFRHEIDDRIRDLNNRLKKIGEDRSALPKLEYTNQDVQVSTVNPRQTFPIEVNSDTVGKQTEEATQGLVGSLVKDDKQKCWILGIVGMGGIGKTTLASNIYNDERIKENFPIRVWVCVSEDFSETELLKEMIRSAGGNYGQAKTKAELIPYFSAVLSKRFIIVLDDIWEAKVWEDLLRYPLESATASGGIVITTRDMNVAMNMRALVYNVDKMDSDDGWALLCKKVFRDDEKEETFNLKEIGIKIVEKCDGLPLAIKTIVGVLRLKKRSSIEWNKEWCMVYEPTEKAEHEIERLGQLRVLDWNCTGLESLPEPIGRLQNLQTLNLSLCKSLHMLPKAITSLCNLRCLRLEETLLTHLPKGIGRLRNLIYLQGFVVGDGGGEEDQGCDLEELQSLSQLRVLQIESHPKLRTISHGVERMQSRK
uniref:Disease resistance protein RGA3 n=1 Tax=Elaeis guineensis var. tenera TaxID=51953 RepID=A0A8N4IBE6_ELAGV|nr:putative disease resistance protein RGA3 [Elaeis guineensis]